MKTHTLHVSGMHCSACTLLVEGEVCECAGVSSAKVSLAERTLTVEGDFGEASAEAIAEMLTAPLATHGYRVSHERPVSSGARWNEFKVAAPIALLVLVAFVALQKLGIVNLIGGDALSYGAVFLVGVVASLSSCLAIVGGLILSVSASYAKSGERVRPQLAFHIARLVSFFILGGAIGAAGSSFAVGPTGSLVLSLLVGAAMLALGLNLLDVFPWARRFQLSAPKALSRGVLRAGHRAGWLAPIALGVATFFLPCGFTQSMQIYALSQGSFLAGALTMLVFALGTLPMLAAVSFSSARAAPARSGTFFKVAGLLAIAFALINIAGGLAAFGIIPPLLNF